VKGTRAIALKYLKNITAETQSTQSKGKVNATLMYYTPVSTIHYCPGFLCVILMQAYRSPGAPAFASAVKKAE